MKTGYPFLRISQKHNLDYGLVLRAADEIKKGIVPGKGYYQHIGISPAANADICKALNYFRLQQVGYVAMTDYADVS